MKFLPYSNINTQNLGMLLLTARLLALLGLIVLGTLIFVFFTQLLGNHSGSLVYGFGAPFVLYGYLAMLGTALLFFSGIGAAIVSFENTYSQKD